MLSPRSKRLAYTGIAVLLLVGAGFAGAQFLGGAIYGGGNTDTLHIEHRFASPSQWENVFTVPAIGRHARFEWTDSHYAYFESGRDNYPVSSGVKLRVVRTGGILVPISGGGIGATAPDPMPEFEHGLILNEGDTIQALIHFGGNPAADSPTLNVMGRLTYDR